ncbi:hypothetical protein GH714_021310 [Hevea brasiliensis]|uniref:Uncharacterized protein n=1 Tax=Hevea brasiliensis TaxID=3981 RepID=A0A6A6N2S4_HEVBR|nr:hypothetical protein GH714_021310 [Hevea brasiliensis]
MSKSDDSYDRNLIGIKPRVEEVERLLTDKQIVGIWGWEGTENVEAISFCPGGRGILKLSATAFAKMCNLRFIEVYAMSNRVLLPKNFEFCAQALRCLYWDFYPVESLPWNFWPKNLVELRMRGSKLIQMWNGGDKPLGNLKLMNLNYSDDLIRISNLSSIAPNLEFLYLEGRMEDVFEAHLLGQKVTLLMAGGEVPERMRRESNAFWLFDAKDVANFDGLYHSDSSQVLLSFNGLRTRF